MTPNERNKLEFIIRKFSLNSPHDPSETGTLYARLARIETAVAILAKHILDREEQKDVSEVRS